MLYQELLFQKLGKQDNQINMSILTCQNKLYEPSVIKDVQTDTNIRKAIILIISFLESFATLFTS